MHKILGKFNEIADGVSIGDNTLIANYCFIGRNVTIGANCKIGNFVEINSGTVIGDNTLINSHCNLNSNTRIGNNTIFSTGVLTADEKYMTPITLKIQKKPCIIGDHVKVGQGARLICTSIGNYASIGAGATVLADHVPPHEVWIGTPARKIRRTSPYEDGLSHT